MAMSPTELLQEVQHLEDEGYLVLIKFDGERSTRKKTIIISKEENEVFIRRDSDDLWESLASAIQELRAE